MRFPPCVSKVCTVKQSPGEVTQPPGSSVTSFTFNTFATFSSSSSSTHALTNSFLYFPNLTLSSHFFLFLSLPFLLVLSTLSFLLVQPQHIAPQGITGLPLFALPLRFFAFPFRFSFPHLSFLFLPFPLNYFHLASFSFLSYYWIVHKKKLSPQLSLFTFFPFLVLVLSPLLLFLLFVLFSFPLVLPLTS